MVFWFLSRTIFNINNFGFQMGILVTFSMLVFLICKDLPLKIEEVFDVFEMCGWFFYISSICFELQGIPFIFLFH
jgi:hypothetical protein